MGEATTNRRAEEASVIRVAELVETDDAGRSISLTRYRQFKSFYLS
jgi:hypothetical protein